MVTTSALHSRQSSSSTAGQKYLNLPEVLRENWLASQDLVPLQDLQIVVSGISLEPLSAAASLERVRSKLVDVLSCYLPCVDFLVSSQEDLSRGLRRRGKRGQKKARAALTPLQFHAAYVEPLPESFTRPTSTSCAAGGTSRA
jgi:hypothetical protein